MTPDSLVISCANYPQLLDLTGGAVIAAICTLWFWIMVLVLRTTDCNNDRGLDWSRWSRWENP